MKQKCLDKAKKDMNIKGRLSILKNFALRNSLVEEEEK